jgi:hypothetical protein
MYFLIYINKVNINKVNINKDYINKDYINKDYNSFYYYNNIILDIDDVPWP